MDTDNTYLAVANEMWKGGTVEEACESLDIDFLKFWGDMSCGVGRYFIALAGLVQAREEYLCSPKYEFQTSCGRTDQQCRGTGCPAIEIRG
jgi:hypothetical protein